MIDGVCGGVAKYFALDPTLVRVAWVLLTLIGGSGILLYIVAMIIMPKEPYAVPQYGSTDSQTTPVGTQQATPSKKNSLFWGIILIAVGMFLFLDNIGLDFWHPWWWFNEDLILPVLLILAGVAFLWGGRNSLSKAGDSGQSGAVGTEAQLGFDQSAPRRLYKSFHDSKIFGVCGGLGNYFGIDSTIVRALFVVATFASGGIVLLGYIILAIVLPKEMPTLRSS
jgi:phage shock protein PspC (stress-responsive transcriptional regulator)